MESSSWETTYNTLCELEENPMNINTATREELEDLPFLTDLDVENISEYLYLYGPMRSLAELAMIKDLDYFKRRLLFYFVYAGEEKKPLFPSLNNILKYGKHEVLATAKIPCYNRKGDVKGYMGYKYKHSIKYDFTYGDYVRFGFLGSQDSGEPFFSGKNNMGYDFYSFYLMLKKLGRIKTLAVGKYRLRFGMGLVINNNYSFGKLSMLTTLGRGGSNIYAHSSRSQANYFQGAATTVNVIKGLDVTLFASYRKFDATLNKGDSTIATILTSGYHRTETELKKKNNCSHLLFGGNVDYRWHGFHVGTTAVYTSLDKELKPKTEAIYRRYYANGKNFYNVGINYGYTGHRISFNGETATGGCHAIATINTFGYSVSEKIDLMALQRFYSYKYYSLFSRSFSEGGAVQDESGVYLGMTWRPIRNMNVMAYSDFAYFAWPKYQAVESSHSFDNLVQIVYSPNKLTFTLRYRLKLREKDNSDKTGLIYKNEHRGRLSGAYNSGAFGFKTQADVSYVKYKKNSFGWMITQNLNYNYKNIVNLIGTFGYFNTDDYDSRLYVYERGMLNSFSVPSYYGKGIRYAFYANCKLFSKFQLTAKVGTSKYFDRSTIGSSYQQINHSSATDVEIQVRMKL